VQPSEVITGAALDGLDDPAFHAAVERSSVFARLKPEHKVRIVTALRKRGIHTAMIGDGVNDVPALRAANLGIAMDEGAEITREVADIILLRNRFTLLPEVFQEGRRIINTVGNVAKLFLTKNFVVIYLTLAAALLLLDFPLTPRRVSLFNIFAIGLPAMVIAFTNRGHERPRRFLLDLVSFVAVSALLIVCTGYAAYYLAPASGAAAEGARAMAMVSAMVLTSILNFLVVVTTQREGGRKRGYVAFAAAMVLVYAGMLSIGPSSVAMRFARTFYEISALDRGAWLAVLGASGGGGITLLLAHWLRATLVRRGE
jgi:cation-transporting ATPase E